MFNSTKSESKTVKTCGLYIHVVYLEIRVLQAIPKRVSLSRSHSLSLSLSHSLSLSLACFSLSFFLSAKKPSVPLYSKPSPPAKPRAAAHHNKPEPHSSKHSHAHHSHPSKDHTHHPHPHHPHKPESPSKSVKVTHKKPHHHHVHTHTHTTDKKESEKQEKKMEEEKKTEEVTITKEEVSQSVSTCSLCNGEVHVQCIVELVGRVGLCN